MFCTMLNSCDVDAVSTLEKEPMINILQKQLDDDLIPMMSIRIRDLYDGFISCCFECAA